MGKTRDLSRLLSENQSNNVLLANAQIFIGDTSGNAYINSTSLAVSNVNANSVSLTAVYSNGSFGISGQVLTSNGTGTFWSNYPSFAIGFSNNITFNDAGYSNGALNFNYYKSTSSVVVGNSISNTTITFSNTSLNGDGATLVVGNSSFSSIMNGNGVLVTNYSPTGNVNITSSAVSLGNSTVNAQLTTSGLTVSGSPPLSVATILTYGLAF